MRIKNVSHFAIIKTVLKYKWNFTLHLKNPNCMGISYIYPMVSIGYNFLKCIYFEHGFNWGRLVFKKKVKV